MDRSKEIQEKPARIFGMLFLIGDSTTITISSLGYNPPQFLCNGVILATPYHGTSTFFFCSLISHYTELLVHMAVCKLKLLSTEDPIKTSDPSVSM